MTDSRLQTPARTHALDIDRLRHDVAVALDVDPADILDTDNLVDHGLDSIRLMLLVQRWHEAGVSVTFDALAARPELRHWAALVGAGTTR